MTRDREHNLALAVDEAKRAWDKARRRMEQINSEMTDENERLYREWFKAREEWQAEIKIAAEVAAACSGAQGLWPLQPELLKLVRARWRIAQRRELARVQEEAAPHA